MTPVTDLRTKAMLKRHRALAQPRRLLEFHLDMDLLLSQSLRRMILHSLLRPHLRLIQAKKPVKMMIWT